MYLSARIARQELVKVSKGQKSSVPLADLASYLRRHCILGSVLHCSPGEATCCKRRDDSVKFLNALYALQDRRTEDPCA